MPFEEVPYPHLLSPKALIQNMSLIVRSSAIHAAGCYTTTSVRKGERIAEYSGRHLSKEQADDLYQDYPVTYLFGLGDGSTVIDGFCSAMFINHSCNGNAETREEDNRIWIFALRDIAADEEITYDYCLYDGSDDPCTCYCGAHNCRGSMYSPQEIKRRKALEAKKLAQRKKRSKRKAAANGSKTAR